MLFRSSSRVSRQALCPLTHLCGCGLGTQNTHISHSLYTTAGVWDYSCVAPQEQVLSINLLLNTLLNKLLVKTVHPGNALYSRGVDNERHLNLDWEENQACLLSVLFILSDSWQLTVSVIETVRGLKKTPDRCCGNPTHT